MTYTVVREWHERFNGTSLQGYVDTTYGELVKAFSEPGAADRYKVDAQWLLEFADGTLATIYNYKTGHNYLGLRGTDVEHITDWHVGGHQPEALVRVGEALGAATRTWS